MIGITGGNGILGRIIRDLFNNSKQSISIYEKDIRDSDSIYDWLTANSISYVIHLASKVAVNEVNKAKDMAYDVNVGGTIQLIKALQKPNNVAGIFYSSSSHIYKSVSEPIKEESEAIPINTYGLTKYISELLLQDFVSDKDNIHLCIGRIFSFYHKSQKPPFLYPNIVERLRSEDLSMPFRLYGAYSVRDFLDAEEVCKIILHLIQIRYKGTINIGSGMGITIKEFVDSIAPQPLIYNIDETEVKTYLVSDITKLNKLLHE